MIVGYRPDISLGTTYAPTEVATSKLSKSPKDNICLAMQLCGRCANPSGRFPYNESRSAPHYHRARRSEGCCVVRNFLFPRIIIEPVVSREIPSTRRQAISSASFSLKATASIDSVPNIEPYLSAGHFSSFQSYSLPLPPSKACGGSESHVSVLPVCVRSLSPPSPRYRINSKQRSDFEPMTRETSACRLAHTWPVEA